MRGFDRHAGRTRAARPRTAAGALVFVLASTLVVGTVPEPAPAATASNGTIAYVAYPPNGSVLEEIYTVVPDGRMKTSRVTNNKASDVAPAWSRDGRRLAVTRFERSGVCALDIYDMSKAPKRIRSYTPATPGQCYYGASWGPGDTHLVVTVMDGWTQSSLHQLHLSTGQTTPIATGAHHEVSYDPHDGAGTMTTDAISDSGASWSADGKQIAFTRTYYREIRGWQDDPDLGSGYDEWLDGGHEYTVVAVHDLDSGNTVEVAGRDLNLAADAWASAPRWHPSGQRLIFAYFGADPLGTDDQVSQIMELELGTGTLEQLTFDGIDHIANFSPLYSPDGLLFLRSRTVSADDEGPAELVVTPLAGGPERVIAGQRMVNQQADWQPRW
jgi:Tol biopolymer transport system component